MVESVRVSYMLCVFNKKEKTERSIYVKSD